MSKFSTFRFLVFGNSEQKSYDKDDLVENQQKKKSIE